MPCEAADRFMFSISATKKFLDSDFELYLELGSFHSAKLD